MLAQRDIDASTSARPGPAAAYAYVSIGVLLASGLFLQRFALPMGELRIHLTTPVMAALLLAGMCARALRVNTRSLILYLAFAVGTITTSLVSLEVDRLPAVRTSLPSLIHTLVLYLPFVFRAAVPLDQMRVLRIASRVLVIVALCGIVQFLLQFAGVHLFTFRPFVPNDYLIEEIFNVVIPIRHGADRFKSNGFFLVEPSVFSQFMAVALMIEIVFFRRVLVGCILATGLFFALSGTGLTVLAIFIALYVATLRSERLSGLILLLVLAGIVVVVATTVFPEFTQALLDRRDEISTSGSSGHQRFVTPFLLMAELAYLKPLYLLYGMGPGSAETIDLGFEHWMNTPGKFIIEYGVPVFLAWLALFVSSAWRRGNALILWPVVYMMLFTGGYHQFSPTIYFVFAIFVFNPAPEWVAGQRGQPQPPLRTEAPALS